MYRSAIDFHVQLLPRMNCTKLDHLVVAKESVGLSKFSLACFPQHVHHFIFFLYLLVGLTSPLFWMKTMPIVWLAVFSRNPLCKVSVTANKQLSDAVHSLCLFECSCWSYDGVLLWSSISWQTSIRLRGGMCPWIDSTFYQTAVSLCRWWNVRWSKSIFRNHPSWSIYLVRTTWRPCHYTLESPRFDPGGLWHINSVYNANYFFDSFSIPFSTLLFNR